MWLALAGELRGETHTLLEQLDVSPDTSPVLRQCWTLTGKSCVLPTQSVKPKEQFIFS